MTLPSRPTSSPSCVGGGTMPLGVTFGDDDSGPRFWVDLSPERYIVVFVDDDGQSFLPLRSCTLLDCQPVGDSGRLQLFLTVGRFLRTTKLAQWRNPAPRTTTAGPH